jgi:hypothetical protein
MTDFQLNRIEGTDIFYFAKGNVQCLGDTIVQGTFDEVLAVAEQLKNEAKDPGTESTTKIEEQTALIDIQSAKWFVIFLNDNLVQIVRTPGDVMYSLPLGLECYEERLELIFERIIKKYNYE